MNKIEQPEVGEKFDAGEMVSELVYKINEIVEWIEDRE